MWLTKQVATLVAMAFISGFTPPPVNSPLTTDSEVNITLPILGAKMAENRLLPDKDRIVLLIDQTEISKEDFENTRYILIAAHARPITAAEVQERLLEDSVMHQEALRRGLAVSPEEAYAFAQETKENLLEANRNGLLVEGYNLADVHAYITNLGYTFDEYFAEIAPKEYQKSLLITKLRQQLSAEVDQVYPGLTPVDEYRRVDDRYENLCAALKAQAVVQIFE